MGNEQQSRKGSPLPTHSPLSRRLASFPTLMSLGVVAVLLVLVVTRVEVNWARTGEVIRGSNMGWFLLAVVAHYSTFLFRGARWKVLLTNAADGDTAFAHPPPTLYLSVVILMAWFANSVTWFRLGDAYRAYAYADDRHASFSRTMGTVVADRLVDLAVVIVMMLVAATVLYSGGQVQPSPLFVVVAAALLFAGLAGLLTMYLLRRWVGPRLPTALGTAYHRFHAGTLGSLRRLHIVFGLGVLGWLAEVGRLFLVVKAVGIVIPTGLVLFVPMANGLLTAVPLTPGGLGIVETGMTGLLMLELFREEAVAIALLDRSISYVSIVVTGGTAFALRALLTARRRAKSQTPQQTEGRGLNGSGKCCAE